MHDCSLFGDGYGLEVPIIYYFTGAENLVKWIKEKLNLCKQNLERKKKQNKNMFEITQNHLLLVS